LHAKGDNKSIESPFFSMCSAVIMSAAQILPGHFTQEGTFLSKKDYSGGPKAFVC